MWMWKGDRVGRTPSSISWAPWTCDVTSPRHVIPDGGINRLYSPLFGIGSLENIVTRET